MDELNQTLGRWQRNSLVVGVLAAAAVIYAYMGGVSRDQFAQSYLMGFLFPLAFSSGCIALLMIHHLVIGRWGFVLQRLLEAGARNFLLVALLFLPVIIFRYELYVWMDPHVVAHDHVLLKKQMYLNEADWRLRAALYFAIWLVLAFVMTAMSTRQDSRPGEAKALELRVRKVAGIGLLIFSLAMTFASFDWIMSLEPKWYSTIFGPMTMVGQGLATLSLLAIVLHHLVKREPHAGVTTPQQFHDVGNLMFAFNILFTYMSVAQYIIIWSGNLPEETDWYFNRSSPGWIKVAAILAVFHFAIPFTILLWKSNKRRSHILIMVAAWFLLMRWLDVVWHVAPTFRHEHFYIHWLDVAAPIALSGIWLAFFFGQLKRRPILPQHDPRFEHLLKAHGDHGH